MCFALSVLCLFRFSPKAICPPASPQVKWCSSSSFGQKNTPAPCVNVAVHRPHSSGFVSTTSFGLAVGEPRSVRNKYCSHFCQRSLMAVLPAGFNAQIQIQNAGRKGVQEIAIFLRSVHPFRSLRSSIRSAFIRNTHSMLRFFPLSVRFIPSLTSEPLRKRSSIHFAFRANAMFRSPSRTRFAIALKSSLFGAGTWNSTPFFGTLRSVASLSLARPLSVCTRWLVESH